VKTSKDIKDYARKASKADREQRKAKGLIAFLVWVKPEWKQLIKDFIKGLENG
jgi:hypothetical protein